MRRFRIGIDCRKAADYGIGTYIRGLLSGLAETGLDATFVLFAPESLRPSLPIGNRFEIITEGSPHYSIRELISVGRAARRARLDVFHATHYVLPLTSLPVVVTIHDLIHLKVPVWRKHPLAPLYARVMLGRAARRADRIVVSTAAVRTEIEGQFAAAEDKVVVTRFGVDSIFTPGEAAPGVLSKYGVQNANYVLFVGNDKPHKNLERLVQAFRMTGDPDLRLLLVGGSSRFEDRRVLRAGFVPLEDLPHLYRGAVALIQPSLEEGFGFPVIESMACETVVVAADIPALREVAAGAALMVDPFSSESMAAAIDRVRSDSDLRDDLRARGLSRSRDFSWRSCAEETMKIYRSIARA